MFPSSRPDGRRPLSRRAALGLTIAAVLAGCSRAVHRATATSPAAASTTPATAPASTSPVPPSTSAAATTPPAPTPAPTGPAVEFVHGSRTRPEVALTFHAAGDLTLSRTLLALLATRGVQVTVMAVGNWLSANPAFAAEVVAAGHEFGNHTWTHPDLGSLGEAAVRSEITRCRDLLTTLTGQPGAFFRQSSAQYSTPLIRQVAGSLGYSTCLSYDIDSLDWTDPGVATVRHSVAAATAGSVVSMHLGHRVTVDALPGILDDLASRGLRPVTASTLLRT